MAKKKQYSEEIQRLLKTVVDECDKEDRTVRERQIRTYRRLKLFWEGFQQVWYSEVAHDWRVWDQEQSSGTDQEYYDKPVNVFRAYLESIIAALSVTIPPIKCYPDDADNVLDLLTAKAGDKIAQLISRHNEVNLLWLHSLFIYCTEGMVACYTYPKEDESYGTYEEKKYDDVEEEHHITSCSNCGAILDSEQVTPDNQRMLDGALQQFQQQQQQGNNAGPINNSLQPANQQFNQQQANNQQHQPQINEEQLRNEFMPDDVELQAMINSGNELCPQCLQMMFPEIRREKFVVTRLVGVTNQPKSRICMEAYGGLYVKAPVYAKNQKECPYLILSDEINYTSAIDEYQHLYDNEELQKQIVARSSSGYDLYDQWARLSPQYRGEYPSNVVTRKRAWVRPSAYNFLSNLDDVKKLKKHFPNGAKVVFINDQFAEACNEALDDCWTLTYNPLSDFIHFDPLGLLLTGIQEITNDLVSITQQTIEHGITQTFIDPAFVDFKAYAQVETVPGGIFPLKPLGNKKASDGFYEMKTATLSQEVMPFSTAIQQFGQLVSGATPSIFGGQLEGSNTASEYSMSRANALQRLQNTWKMFTIWWKTIYGKVIPMYIKEVKEDERDVQKDTDGNFFNVFIRRAELEGKIGKIELEANENLPLTWSQIKDVILNIMNGQNPALVQMMTSPENLPLLYEAIGLTDFYVPGEDDREQQYDEIKLLLNSTPIETGDPVNPMMPSIEIDPIYDNNGIGFEIIRKWAVSEAGRQAKVDNPPGYMNVLLHGKMHYQQIQMQMMQQQQQQEQQQQAPAKKPKQPSLKNAPIQGEQNVATVQ